MTRRLRFTLRHTDPTYREAGVRIDDTDARVTAWHDGRVTLELRDGDRPDGPRIEMTYYPAHHPRGNRDPSRALVMFDRAEGALDIEEPNA